MFPMDMPSPADKRMLEEQLKAPGRGIENLRVLESMLQVPRHAFVPEAFRKFAYRDEPQPIGYGQTISQPFVVAFMTEQLDPQATDQVLEIGTGSGYQAAVLSRLVAEVCGIEIIEPLARRAQAEMKRLGYDNVNILVGDGYKGWPVPRTFDSIIVCCAPEHVPPALIDQLKDEGRMIIPVGVRGRQQLILLRKHGTMVEKKGVMAVRFLSMTRNSEADG